MKKAGRATTTSPKVAINALRGAPSYRKDRVLIAGYFARSVKAAFRMIQVTHVEKSVQDLMNEAFADLFLKYDVQQTIAPVAKKQAAD